MPNLRFNADVERWAILMHTKIADVLQNVATVVHSRLGERTPYLTGRARASWNFNEGKTPDLNPAPAPPFPVLDPLNPTPEELAQLNAFYDPIFDRKNRTTLSKSARSVVISNNVPYIDFLNAGGSRQAPALFFQSTVIGLELIAQREIDRLSKL